MEKNAQYGFFETILTEKNGHGKVKAVMFMFNYMKEIKLINVVRGIASVHTRYPARPAHGLILRLDGCSSYEYEGGLLTLHPGEMVLIPKGTVYEVRRLEEHDTEYIVFNFDCDIPGAVPRLFSAEGFPRLEEVWRMDKNWLFGGDAGRLRCIGMVYDLLAWAAAREAADYGERRQLGRLAPAVEYLQQNNFDAALRVEGLHSLCGMSDTYFRRLFRAAFDASPREYIIDRRLIRARDLLETGDCATVGAAAAAVGYTDALYFSRIFAKRYGMPPSAIAGIK